LVRQTPFSERGHPARTFFQVGQRPSSCFEGAKGRRYDKNAAALADAAAPR
jgi:hypothetical protein